MIQTIREGPAEHAARFGNPTTRVHGGATDFLQFEESLVDGIAVRITIRCSQCGYIHHRELGTLDRIIDDRDIRRLVAEDVDKVRTVHGAEQSVIIFTSQEEINTLAALRAESDRQGARRSRRLVNPAPTAFNPAIASTAEQAPAVTQFDLRPGIHRDIRVGGILNGQGDLGGQGAVLGPGSRRVDHHLARWIVGLIDPEVTFVPTRGQISVVCPDSYPVMPVFQQTAGNLGVGRSASLLGYAHRPFDVTRIDIIRDVEVVL